MSGSDRCPLTYVLAGPLVVPMVSKVSIDVHAGACMARIAMTVLAPETILEMK